MKVQGGTDESGPIGHACMNSDVIVLNEKNELVETNEKGELCVRCSFLLLGYYNNSEKTAATFVQNSLNMNGEIDRVKLKEQLGG